MRLCDFKKLLVFGVLVVALTLAVQAASPKDTVSVKDIAITSTGDALEARITASSEVEKFTYFELEGPRRLVVDFHGFQNGIGFAQKKVQTAGVERIRTSYFSTPDRKATRIVFDLKSGINYQVLDDGAGVVRVVFGDMPAMPAKVPFMEAVPMKLVPGPAVVVNQEEGILASLAKLSPTTMVLQESPAPEAPPVTQTAVLLPPVASTTKVSVAPSLLVASPQVSTGTPSVQPVLTTAADPQTFNGEIVTFDLKDIDVKDFFKSLAEISGLNITLDTNVTGLLTITLRDVPWDQALDIVLRNYSLGAQLTGNVMRVATQATLASEANARKAAADALANSTPLVTQTYILNYTKADVVAPTLKNSGAVSLRGNVIAEPRRNALIVYDVPAQFSNIDKMVKFIDVPSQQVDIEARLLTANKSFSREIGSQLGFLVGNNSGNILTGAAGASSPFARTPPPRATTGGSGLPLLSNLPAAGTSGIAFLMQPGGDILLDEIITAAEARGTARLMSRPHVVTQNNMVAEISQGTQIPVQTNVNNTISVSFLTFALKLNVTPQITEAGTILLTVEIENSQPDFARAVNGVPSVSTQQAKTQTLVADGSTMMIGGIYVDTDSLNVRQVPGIGSLPVIGHLFKNTSTIKSTAELLFFITPRIKPTEGVTVTTPAAN
jgi:type IV pilus secretin PilQ/predicted competence protein